MNACCPATPEIIGVRHHSPACARLVAARIRALRPAHVLIEGPADFNERLAELYLPHQPPLAIFSYLCGESRYSASWSPLAEHSPEWQALQVAREVGAQPRFIDLPAWHTAFVDTPNRYADVTEEQHDARARAYEAELARRTGVEGRDALWDHLFEDEAAVDELAPQLRTYFHLLRGDDPGSAGNQARELMMARWIAWAMARRDGPVLVVCGGYHAPALEQLWPTLPSGKQPAVPAPAPESADTDGTPDMPRFGSFLVPYTFKRLDALTGYASGMPSPAWRQWVWEHGNRKAGELALQGIVRRLRERKLPVSTADLKGVHLRTLALSHLRGHRQPLRNDWLDALAGALLKDGLEAPLPWSYDGPLLPGTDPQLVEMMDVLAGDSRGRLAPGTPQPPLVQDVSEELHKHAIRLQGQLQVDLLSPAGRPQSRILHRLRLLAIPGIQRSAGPDSALAGATRETWQLAQPLEQSAALIEAGAYGPTLREAATARLEELLRQSADDIGQLVKLLDLAAWAGLQPLSRRLLADLAAAVAREARFEVLAPALRTLFVLYRHGQHLEMSDAEVLRTLLESGFDRALWLLEPAARLAPAERQAHLNGQIALCELACTSLAAASPADAVTPLHLSPQRAIAVWQRKAAQPEADPASRGAALGALIRCAQPVDDSALHLLADMSAASLGDALAGLLALAREQLAHNDEFIAGLDRLLQGLNDVDFIQALPGLRDALGWLPTLERARLADAVLELHQARHLPRRSLTAPLGDSATALANAARIERQALARLAQWGIQPLEEIDP